MVYRSVNISRYVCTSFSIYILCSVRVYALFFPHTTVLEEFCGPVDVASMPGALAGGAHENMP